MKDLRARLLIYCALLFVLVLLIVGWFEVSRRKSNPGLFETKWQIETTSKALSTLKNMANENRRESKDAKLVEAIRSGQVSGLSVSGNGVYDIYSKNNLAIVEGNAPNNFGFVTIKNVDYYACTKFGMHFVEDGLMHAQRGESWYASVESSKGKVTFNLNDSKEMKNEIVTMCTPDINSGNEFEMFEITFRGL